MHKCPRRWNLYTFLSNLHGTCCFKLIIECTVLQYAKCQIIPNVLSTRSTAVNGILDGFCVNLKLVRLTWFRNRNWHKIHPRGQMFKIVSADTAGFSIAVVFRGRWLWLALFARIQRSSFLTAQSFSVHNPWTNIFNMASTTSLAFTPGRKLIDYTQRQRGKNAAPQRRRGASASIAPLQHYRPSNCSDVPISQISTSSLESGPDDYDRQEQEEDQEPIDFFLRIPSREERRRTRTNSDLRERFQHVSGNARCMKHSLIESILSVTRSRRSNDDP